jgi:predicted MPP superfamily phosphohydrolase
MLFSKKWFRQAGSLAIDAFCIGTVVGIWPRFIEPKRLKVTRLPFTFGKKELKGLKIVQLSDLHFHERTSSSYLKKVASTLQKESPDLILFTGDFICYAKLEKRDRLKSFLNDLKAPLGKFCIFGNHDYDSYVSRTLSGNYEILKPAHPIGGLYRGLKSLLSKNVIGRINEEVLRVPLHQDLCNLLDETGFEYLENRNHTLACGLNLVGLGDYALGRFLPEKAFSNYDQGLPGIVLSHNPDTIGGLKDFPGNLILTGHTHGEQIHFPYPPLLRKLSLKLTRLESNTYTRGFYKTPSKSIYVNRGIGCHKPLRFLSPPEILVIEVDG